jgi:anti-sigma B factor antagonist
MNILKSVHADHQRQFDARDMEINTSAKETTGRETTVVVAIEHDLVASNAQVLRRDILPRIWEGTKNVDMDFSHVRMIDSIGIASLIAVYNRLQKTGGILRLFNVSAEVFHLLHALRLDRHIEVKASG